MNQIASDTIAAVKQVLAFFFLLEDSSTSFYNRMLIILIGSESGDKSNVTFNWGLQKIKFAERGLRNKTFGNLGFKKMSASKHSGTNIATFYFTLMR